MKKHCVFYWLTGYLLLSAISLCFSAEPVEEKNEEAEIQISTEDQQVIALMELLQKMDMLKDLDLITTTTVEGKE
jgi:hypothetical protein